MKYSGMLLKKDKYGFSFAKAGVMATDKLKPCLVCKKPTAFVEVCSEGYQCSEECTEEFYKELDVTVESMDREEVLNCQQ